MLIVLCVCACVCVYVCVGFLEKEVKKDGIPMLDTGDNPDAPAPREMIDLEVGSYYLSSSLLSFSFVSLMPCLFSFVLSSFFFCFFFFFLLGTSVSDVYLF